MTYIRVHNAGDDSTKSPTSTLLQPQAGIKLTNQLSYLLNKERNELMKYELAIPTTTTSSHIVATMLSTKPVITSKSSLPVLRQNQQSIRVVGYRCIGFGQCGIICERLGIAYVVKLARPMYKKGLWAGFKPTSLSEKHSNSRIALNVAYPGCSLGFQSQTLTGERKPLFVRRDLRSIAPSDTSIDHRAYLPSSQGSSTSTN
jgi:hypothetical protein